MAQAHAEVSPPLHLQSGSAGRRGSASRNYSYRVDEVEVPFLILENPFAEQQLDLTPVPIASALYSREIYSRLRS